VGAVFRRIGGLVSPDKKIEEGFQLGNPGFFDPGNKTLFAQEGLLLIDPGKQLSKLERFV